MIGPSNILWNKLLFTKDGLLFPSPGVVTLSGNARKFGWDIQEATGTSGGVTKPTKDPIKQFDAEFYIVDEVGPEGATDFDEWDSFQELLESTRVPGKKPTTLEVYHPDLKRNGIDAVTVGEIGEFITDNRGGGRIKVHFLEYRPPKPITTSPSTKTAGDKAIDDANAEIDALNKEYATL